MENEISVSLAECFGEIRDPRVEGWCEQVLIEVIIIAICALITGAESGVEVETFGQLKESWLKKFLKLPGGIPSHDTFGRIFAALDAEAFQKGFARWVEGVCRVTDGQGVDMDGKTVRPSHNKKLGKAALHMVNAWASETGLVLGQRKVDDNSNEITAIPELLRLVDVSGCIVTIDALGCQKTIAQTIRDEKAEYVLQVKENQGHLYQDIQDWFAYTDQHPAAASDRTYHETVNKAHGRLEIRRCWAIADPLAFEAIRHQEGWADLHRFVRLYRERRFDGKVERETSYSISSLVSLMTRDSFPLVD